MRKFFSDDDYRHGFGFSTRLASILIGVVLVSLACKLPQTLSQSIRGAPTQTSVGTPMAAISTTSEIPPYPAPGTAYPGPGGGTPYPGAGTAYPLPGGGLPYPGVGTAHPGPEFSTDTPFPTADTAYPGPGFGTETPSPTAGTASPSPGAGSATPSPSLAAASPSPRPTFTAVLVAQGTPYPYPGPGESTSTFAPFSPYPGPGTQPPPSPSISPSPGSGTTAPTFTPVFVSTPSPTFSPSPPVTVAAWPTATGIASPTPSRTPFLTPTPSLTPTPTATRTPYPLPPWVSSELRATDPRTVTLASGRVQLIEFFAFWSGISQAMAPIVHNIEDRYGSRMNFIYLDIDNPATEVFQEQLRFRREPQFFLLDAQGKILDQWTGYVSYNEFMAAINSALR